VNFRFLLSILSGTMAVLLPAPGMVYSKKAGKDWRFCTSARRRGQRRNRLTPQNHEPGKFQFAPAEYILGILFHCSWRALVSALPAAVTARTEYTSGVTIQSPGAGNPGTSTY